MWEIVNTYSFSVKRKKENTWIWIISASTKLVLIKPNPNPAGFTNTQVHTSGKRNVLTSLSSFYKESTVIVNDNHLFYWHFPCSQMAGSPRKVYSPVTVSHNIWFGKYRMWIKEPHIRHHIRSAYDLSCRTDTWKHSPVHNTRLLKQCSPTRSGE